MKIKYSGFVLNDFKIYNNNKKDTVQNDNKQEIIRMLNYNITR